MRQYEHRNMVGRIRSPPALPAIVRPRSADGTEHVSSQYPRADILEAAGGEVLVDVSRPAFLAEHAPECARRECPLMQRAPADAQRIFQALPRSRSEAVE